MPEPMRITHLITGLGMGGAEMVLYKLIKGTQGNGFSHAVIALTENGPVGRRIASLGVPIKVMVLGKNILGFSRLFKLRKILRGLDSDLVQTWLYHADLAGIVFAKLPVIWNIQNGKLDPQKSAWTTRLVQRFCIPRSSKPAAIIYCTNSAKKDHEAIGYRNSCSVVIENGTDTERFHPDAEAKIHFRSEWKIREFVKLVGHVGRYDPQKDYPTMMQAFGKVARKCPNVEFVLCGEGLTKENEALAILIEKNSIAGRVHLLGLRTDVEHILPAFDLFVLTSAYGEGFPNVLGEAMACGVPCVSSDVGDAVRIIGQANQIFSIGDGNACAQAILCVLEKPMEDRNLLAKQSRQQIIDHFSLTKTLQKYQDLYHDVSSSACYNDRVD